MDKIELLAPAGDLEKLKIAVIYGADAVYFGGEGFSLRASSGSMDPDEMREGVEFAHSRGCRAYLALNIFAHNDDLEKLPGFLDSIEDIPLDAFLISDPGVFDILMEKRPDAEVHLSTQANNTNYRSALFWHRMGVTRVVAAREMSMAELKGFREKLPDDMEIEAFVHGAMCISYSGRCLLSNFMAGRDANRGLCAHPCRWNYRLVEEKRPGEYYDVEEDERGTYVFNSKDLCMIEHMDDIIEAGIASAKIEGRMKSIFYLATVVRAYRAAIDAYYRDPEHYTVSPEWLDELEKVSNRHFTTGFFYGKPDENSQNYESSAYIRNYDFIGIVRNYDTESGIALVEQRNNFRLGDEIEVFGPGYADMFTFRVDNMKDAVTGEDLQVAPHAQQKLRINFGRPVKKDFMLRRRCIQR